MKMLYRKGSPPVERCLAGEAEKGSPPAKRSSILTRRQDFGELSRAALIGPIVTDRCAVLGVLARQALVAETELTPKPALVDRRGSGAHADLSLAIMRRSAFAIEPFERRQTEIPISVSLMITSVDGFKSGWKAVLDRFFGPYGGAVRIEINDAGATLGAVSLRLQQAVEASGR